MTIEIVRNYVTCKIKGTLPDDVHAEFRERMRYRRKGFRFSYVYKKGWGDGYRYLFTPKRQVFPSGLFFSAEKILQKHNLSYTVSDLRTKPTLGNSIHLQSATLRDYQQQMQQTCLQHGSGIVRAATGSGKTVVFASILGIYNGLERIVYVRKLDLMAQTIRVLQKQLGVPVGRIGGGVVNIQELSVAMIPTVSRAVGEEFIKYTGHFNDDEDDPIELSAKQKMAIKEYVQNAQCFIIDECHCTSCESMQMINKHSKSAYYRLGFSATPWREDGSDILIHAATGPQLVNIPASDLIKRGYLVPPRVHFYQIPKPDFRTKIPNDYHKVYTQFIVENDVRNEKIVKLTKFLVENGERPVVIVQRQQHGKILEDLMQKAGMIARFIYGESSMTERQVVLDQFQNDVIDVVIGSSILQEGIDIPCITALVNASAGKSSSAYYQKIGRAIRPFENKTRAIVIDFIDNVKWLKKHSKRRIKVLQTEPLYELKIQQ